MGATTLDMLLTAYGAGARRPRGEVLERLKWLNFMAWKRERCVDNLVRKYPQYIGAKCLENREPGNTLCSVMKPWEQSEDDRLLDEVLALTPIMTIATNHGRTSGAIVSRLGHSSLVYYDQQDGVYRIVHSIYAPRVHTGRAFRQMMKALKARGFRRRDDYYYLPPELAGKILPWSKS